MRVRTAVAMNLYWGDLHSHCAASYGTGTVHRALANASEHLDFCSITGHAFWPDMPHDLEENDATMIKHYGGFAKLQRFWSSLLDAVDKANRPGSFVAFPSYEWHSLRYGDHNCYVRDGELPLLDADTPAGLAAALREAGREPLVLPHHIGYGAGHRGIAWDAFAGSRSPLVEIFSNHGASEADDAPYPYHHNMGPRFGGQTARAGLVAGHRFGFQAGTDTHDGYPGHYGHGRVGVFADRLDRAALWEGLIQRRTIATTGAAIRLEVELEGAGIGAVAPRRDEMQLRIRVEGTDAIDTVEWIEGGAWGWRVHRTAAVDRASTFVSGRHKIRVQTGWGRHGTRSSWHVRSVVGEGGVRAVTPYFRYSGHSNADAEVTERIVSRDDREVVWDCHARAVPNGGIGGTHHHAGGPQTVLLEVDAREGTRLRVEANDLVLDAALPELARASIGAYEGGLSTSAAVVHRAVPEREFAVTHEDTVRPRGDAGFVYVRVRQSDGQVAWSSPIFFE